MSQGITCCAARSCGVQQRCCQPQAYCNALLQTTLQNPAAALPAGNHLSPAIAARQQFGALSRIVHAHVRSHVMLYRVELEQSAFFAHFLTCPKICMHMHQ